MPKITGELNGNGGAFQWLGKVELNVSDGSVSGTITWKCPQGYDGTETVVGTLDGSSLNFEGVGEVANRGRHKVVNCSYSGTLEMTGSSLPGKDRDGSRMEKLQVR